MSTAAHGTWTVLDTHLGRGEGLLHSAQRWAQTHGDTGVLHYVALCDAADLALWRSGHYAATDGSPLARELNTACSTALPGIQRLLLQGGHISLTLCAGPVRTMLSEQFFQADEVRLVCDEDPDAQAIEWDKWAVQLLARRCRRGTRLRCLVTGHPTRTALHDRLAAQGFVWAETGHAEYQPRWELRTTRAPLRQSAPATGHGKHCAVVGAGLAGASVAQALALRGWQVTVLDAGENPASGASGLPVGLVVPHVSVDDSPRSRMSRVGVRLTLQHARRLLHLGQDWRATGVMEFDVEAPRRLNASTELQAATWLAAGDTSQALWHPHAAWIKPARLIEAWLSQPGIRWMGSSQVARLLRQDANWVLQDRFGKTLLTADTVVVANAVGALPLLQSLTPDHAAPTDLLRKLQLMQSLHGTVSHGSMPDGSGYFPPFPVNGNGSLVANIPTQQGPRWYAGATYETDSAAVSDAQAQHAQNFQRLQALSPDVAAVLSKQFAEQQVETWTGSRCVSHDRLPLIGPVHAERNHGLWLSIAMGSRGLSFAALCAECLAADIGHEPLPVEARLLRSLDVHRTLRRQADAPAP